MRREVWPLVKNWPARRRSAGGRDFVFYEQLHAVAVCGGIGAEHARRATEAVIELYQPDLVISAGFAGALQADLPVGRVVTPAVVLDARDGSRTIVGSGEGVLISFDRVADASQKAKLAASYGAHAVDMEAAAVARGAEAHGLPFIACKAISDAHNLTLPPTDRFVGTDGQFQTGRFVRYAALRPGLWGSIWRLARNAATAAKALCNELDGIIRREAREPAEREPLANATRKEASEPVLGASASLKP